MIFCILGCATFLQRLAWYNNFIYEFVDPMLSAKYICNNHVDVVLAVEKMRPVDGAALRKVLNIHKRDLPVIILSESNDEVLLDEGEQLQGT